MTTALRSLAWFALLMGALVLSPPAFAQPGPGPAVPSASCDRFADAGSGHDTAGTSGSISDPYRSAQHLLDKVAAGGVACLRSGTYAVSDLSLGTPNVTLQPAHRESVAIVGRVRVERGGSGSTIQGLTINGHSSANPSDATTLLIFGDDVTIRGDDISNDNTSTCIEVDHETHRATGVPYPNPSGVRIADSVIHHCGDHTTPQEVNSEHGIYLSHSDDATIHKDWIYANDAKGINLYSDADGTTVSHDVIVENQTGVIFAGSGPGTAPEDPWPNESSDDNAVIDNVIAFNGRFNLDESWGAPVGTGNAAVRNCLYTPSQDPFLSGAPPASGILGAPIGFVAAWNMPTAPQFVGDPLEGDLRLVPDSPCALFLGWS